jgi:hypothetical protein
MGAHIVKRRPPVIPLPPAAQRPTTEITEQQLREILLERPPDRVQMRDDLEAELEIVADLPKAFPDATPTSLPSTSSLRFARTLRRTPSSEAAGRSAGAPAPIAAPAPTQPPVSSEPELVLATPEAPPSVDLDMLRRPRLIGARGVLLISGALSLLTLGALILLR